MRWIDLGKLSHDQSHIMMLSPSIFLRKLGLVQNFKLAIEKYLRNHDKLYQLIKKNKIIVVGILVFTVLYSLHPNF